MGGNQIRELDRLLKEAGGIIIGAGAGLSASAGMAYSGPRFEENFGDFIEKYHFPDMYTGGFYPFSTMEEHWAYWSRYVWLNRYGEVPGTVYSDLLELVGRNDYFVLTTNVDHCFQRTGFDKRRLFYTQGDFGLFQCSKPCCRKTYDNEAVIRRMVQEQADMKIPGELVPRCPVCSRPMGMNLRSDDTFVQDDGWYQAEGRWREYLRSHEGGRILFLELGVGGNTPGIIKYPFWQMTYKNPNSFYAVINTDKPVIPHEIADRSLWIQGDIGQALAALGKERGKS